MPVAIIDSFKTLKLMPDDVSVVAETTSDTLTLTAGIGINFIVDPLTDSIQIYNTGQGLATLDEVLNFGNVTDEAMQIGGLRFDGINQIAQMNTDADFVLKTNGTGTLYIDSTKAVRIPVGTSAERPTPVTGQIRFNSDTTQFEGYNGIAWSSLGGVKSVDGYTYIISETSSGASNGDLDFYAENAAGNNTVQVGRWNRNNLQDYTGTVVGTQTTQNVFNTIATTVNAFGAGTTITIGANGAGTLTIRNNTVSISNHATIGGTLGVTGNTTLTADLEVNGGDFTTNQSTFNLLNTTATTLNVGGAATAVNIGAVSGTLTVNNNLLNHNSTGATKIAVGTALQRPTAATGQIRFNTDTSQFEGYQGSNWTSLGGVRDVDGNTYILPEATPGANDNTLWLYANGNLVSTFDDTGLTVHNGRTIAFRETTPNGVNTISIQAPDNVPSDYTLTLPPSLGVFGSYLGLNASGQLEFVVPDAFGGSALYVSSTYGNDENDGVSKPVKTLKRALEIASSIVYSPTFEYNEAACKRDVGLIIESLGYDLAYGSNWRSILSGWSYYSVAASPAITTQKTQTLLALKYLKSKALETQTGTPATTLGNLADVIYNIVNTGTSAAPTVSMPNPTGSTTAQQNAKRLILANIVNGFIDAEITAWIQDKISTNAWPGFTYNAATCARDVRYISYAIAYDLIYGGNSQSRYAGLKYYDALLDVETLQIPSGQKAYTIDALTKLKSVLISVAQALAVVPHMSAINQDTSGSGGGSSEVTTITSLMDVVLNILNTGPSASPTLVNPTATKIYSAEQAALVAKTELIQYNVIAKTSDYKPNGNKISVNVAAGEYYEDNPLIVPDNISVIGASLRACNIRPLNANKDFLRVRNASYFSEFTFRDALDANGTPVSTWNHAVSFDNPNDETVDRLGYAIMPNSKPIIDISPYIQNCSIISFLGGNGALVDGNLVVTPNVPKIQLLTENPVSGPAPEQGHSMVANAFTMLTFGGTAWRVINDAYIQIVSCFQIFAQNGTYCQSGGYASITNSATNFGTYSLRSSGYSPNAFAFDKGYVATTGTYNSLQSITALGFGRAPTQDYVVRFRDPSYKYAYDLLMYNKSSIVLSTSAWIDSQIASNTAPFIGYNYTGSNRIKGERDLSLVIEAVALDILTGGNSNSVAAGLSYQDTVTNLTDIAIASITHAKGLSQTALASLTGKGTLAGTYFDIITNAIADPLEAPNAVPYGSASEITSSYAPSSTTVSFNAATAVNVSSNIFTINSHGFLNGDSVIYNTNGGTQIQGLFNEQTYYINYINSNTFTLSYDDSLSTVVDVIAVGIGNQTFIKNLQEFYIKDLVDSHNSYQILTLASGTYTFTPGQTIIGTSSGTANNAYVYSYDPILRQLVVSLNQVTINGSAVRNPFQASSVITSDNGSPAVTNISVTAVASRTDLYSGTFTILGTTTGAQLSNLITLPTKQIWLHRPSIVNSSAHTWEYAGSGTDYNALPQNGGKTRSEFEQYADLPGRVYTSGTNELGDFKVGNFITAQNRTGNVSFTNKVSVNQLDALRLAVGDIVIDYISNDIGLGDNEAGGAKDSRLSTQLAIRSFLANRLGNFIDKDVSTNSVPGAIVQLNSSGQINTDLLPSVKTFTSGQSNGYLSRLNLVEEIPASDFSDGDIVNETFSTVQLTLSANVTFSAGVIVTQATTNATGYLVSDVTNSNVITVASYGNVNGHLFNASFNTTNNLTINGDSTPSVTNTAVNPTLVGTIGTGNTNNYVLTNSNISQYLILNTSGTYSFTPGNIITGANDSIQATIVSTRYGVINTVNVGSFTQGSGYTPASGSTTYQYVALTGGSGSGAIADITVTNGQVTNVDLRRGGTGYAVGNNLSASAASIGGTVSVAFSIPVTTIQQRLYVTSLGGQKFTASSLNPNFIADNNAPSTNITLTSTTVKSFNAADVGSGGNVNTSTSTITISSHGFTNGDPVVYSPGINVAIGGLINGDVYYIKVINSNDIRLYNDYSLTSLQALTSSSSGTHTLTINVINTVNNTVYIPAHGYTVGTALKITGTALPQVDGVTIPSASFFFVGSVTTNSFTLHTSRLDSLSSINGLVTSPVNFTSTGSSTATITKQNVSVYGVVNTSSANASAWSPLSTSNVDASNIISGTINTSRLGSSGTANNTTYLRGDSTWHTAVQSIKETNTPLTITGSYTTSGSDNLYYGDIGLDIDKVDSTGGDATYSNLGVAKFYKTQFGVGTGASSGQVYIKDGVIDAGTLDGLDSTYFLNPANLSSAVPVTKGGTNLSSYTTGDIIYADGTTSLAKLNIGSANQVLIVNSLGTAPQWSSSLTLGGSLTVNGNLTVTGSTTTVNTTTVQIDDKNIELGKASAIAGLTATISTGNTSVTLASTAGLIPGMALTKTAGVGAFGASPYIVSVDSATQINLNVQHATSGAITFTANGYSDLTADNGGITLKGTTDKTIIWDTTNANWTSSENWNIASGKTFKIANTTVLSSTQVLGKTIGGTSSGDIASIDATQTLTNKTLQDSTTTIQDNTNVLKKFQVDAAGVGGSGATFTVSTNVSGQITSATLASGGSGYAVNDVITIEGPGTPSVKVSLTINTITSGGVIATFTPTVTLPTGTGYTVSQTNVVASSALGSAIATRAFTVPGASTTLVGTDSYQTLTNKTFASPTISNAAINSVTTLSLRDTAAAFDLTIASTSNASLTASRTLTLDVNNANRTLDIAGNLTLANDFITSGNNSLTLTTSGLTNVTLPTTGTLATLTNTETLSGKTLTTPKINDTSSTHTYNIAVNELAATRTITLPLLTADDTFVFAAHTQTLTNKTLTDSLTYFQDDVDNTKKMQLQLSSIGTNTTRVLTVPNVDGTIITSGDTGTVTNTMLAGSIANTKLSNSSVTIGTTVLSLGATSTTVAGLTSVTSTNVSITTSLDSTGTTNLRNTYLYSNPTTGAVSTFEVNGYSAGSNDYSFRYTGNNTDWLFNSATLTVAVETDSEGSWSANAGTSDSWNNGLRSKRRFKRVEGLTLEYEAYQENVAGDAVHYMVGFGNGDTIDDNSDMTRYNYSQTPANLIYHDNGALSVYDNGTTQGSDYTFDARNAWYRFKIVLKAQGATYYVFRNNVWNVIKDTTNNYSNYESVRVLISSYRRKLRIRNMNVYVDTKHRRGYDYLNNVYASTVTATTFTGALTGTASNANLLDNLDSTDFSRRQYNTQASNLPVGWYTVAVNIGDRASARFTLKDIASSYHQSVTFYASHFYGTNSDITVVHQSAYSTTPFRYIRIKEGGTYDGALLQIYIDSAASIVQTFMFENDQSSGWVLKNWVADGVDPGGTTIFANLINVASQVDLDAGGAGNNTLITTGDIYAGGDTTQYKVWHSNNDGSGSGLDADLLDGLNSATANTASTIVARDASGNFSAGTITATLSGNASTATTSTNIAGGSAGTIPYQTGASTTAMLAAGTSGYFLKSNNTSAPSWVGLSLTDLPDAWVKKSVRAATTANITLSAPQTIDGIAVVAGDRVLVKDQTTASQNGIYLVAAAAWTRATDADTISKLAGACVNVDAGTANGGFRFDNDNKITDTLDTTSVVFFRVYDTNDSATANTANKLVLRDASGNFSAGTITAAISATTIASTQGVSDVSGTGSALRIANPGGASYATNTSAVTGAIKIKLPVAANNSSTMMRFRVTIYEYAEASTGRGTSRTFEIGGYNYSAGSWYNTFATQLTAGGGDLNVRWGFDATSDCIWIGDTTTVWAYPQVFVTDFQGGFSGYTQALWASGWTVSFVSTLDTVEIGPIVAAKVFHGAVSNTPAADNTYTLGSTTKRFSTLYGTGLSTGADANAGTIQGIWTLTGTSRMQATYADLAEKYVADKQYEPGTVVMFGGEKEVTLATMGSRKVAGIISTNAAYIMNTECQGEFVVELALQGRVPCKVRGKIRKGDMLIADTDGYATNSEEPLLGQVIGKALENYDGDDGIIEVVVGRL